MEEVMPKHEPALGADLLDRIRRLVESQNYAVLSTRGEGQPYASIVALS
jgi:hypothetical protein